MECQSIAITTCGKQEINPDGVALLKNALTPSPVTSGLTSTRLLHNSSLRSGENSTDMVAKMLRQGKYESSVLVNSGGSPGFNVHLSVVPTYELYQQF